jgi:hypothetical protein
MPPTPDVFHAVPHILPPISPVFAAVPHVLSPIANVLVPIMDRFVPLLQTLMQALMPALLHLIRHLIRQALQMLVPMLVPALQMLVPMLMALLTPLVPPLHILVVCRRAHLPKHLQFSRREVVPPHFLRRPVNPPVAMAEVKLFRRHHTDRILTGGGRAILRQHEIRRPSHQNQPKRPSNHCDPCRTRLRHRLCSSVVLRHRSPPDRVSRHL